jgi:carboxymethylenebutenolidase
MGSDDDREAALARPEVEHDDDVAVSEVRLPSRRGSAPALLYRPLVGGPGPAVVLAAEAYGVNSFTRRVAATLAHLGYVTLVPDYYRGDGPTDPEGYLDFTEVVQFIDALDFVQATHDVIAGIEYLQADPGVRPDRVAVWGYCTGATLALLAAALRPELAAAVLFFPSQPTFDTLDAKRPVHPVDLLWHAGCPLLFVYGDQDPVMSPAQLADLGRRLDTWGIDHTIKIYPGAGHAFSAPVAPLRHDAADRASWVDAVRFLGEHASS